MESQHRRANQGPQNVRDEGNGLAQLAQPINVVERQKSQQERMVNRVKDSFYRQTLLLFQF